MKNFNLYYFESNAMLFFNDVKKYKVKQYFKQFFCQL